MLWGVFTLFFIGFLTAGFMAFFSRFLSGYAEARKPAASVEPDPEAPATDAAIASSSARVGTRR